MTSVVRFAFLACLLIGLFVAAPLAAAQGQPTTSITWAGQPEKPVPSTREVSLAALTLTLRLSAAVCSQPATWAATLAATVTMAGNVSSNATAVVNPAQLTFSVPQGAYGTMAVGGQAGGPYRSQPQAVTVAVTAPGVTASNATVKVTATLPAYAGMACSGTAAIPGDTKTAEYVVAYNVTQAPSSTPTQKLPVPMGWTLVGVLVALAVTRSGRRA